MFIEMKTNPISFRISFRFVSKKHRNETPTEVSQHPALWVLEGLVAPGWPDSSRPWGVPPADLGWLPAGGGSRLRADPRRLLDPRRGSQSS